MSGLYKNVVEWSGFMRQIIKETTTDLKHQVDFQPFIDIDSNNLSPIYTALMFIVDECDTHENETVVTFNQPL